MFSQQLKRGNAAYQYRGPIGIVGIFSFPILFPFITYHCECIHTNARTARANHDRPVLKRAPDRMNPFWMALGLTLSVVLAWILCAFVFLCMSVRKRNQSSNVTGADVAHLVPPVYQTFRLNLYVLC